MTLHEAIRLSRVGSALSYRDEKRHPLDYEAQAKEHLPTHAGASRWFSLCTPDSPQYHLAGDEQARSARMVHDAQLGAGRTLRNHGSRESCR